MEMRNYDVDKVRVKNHSIKLYQSENKTKPKTNSIQTKVFGPNSAPNDKEIQFSN